MLLSNLKKKKKNVLENGWLTFILSWNWLPFSAVFSYPFELSCFQRNSKVLLQPWHCWRRQCCCHHGAETLTFCNVSVISEDIYLKLGVCVYYPMSNP